VGLLPAQIVLRATTKLPAVHPLAQTAKLVLRVQVHLYLVHHVFLVGTQLKEAFALHAQLALIRTAPILRSALAAHLVHTPVLLVPHRA